MIDDSPSGAGCVNHFETVSLELCFLCAPTRAPPERLVTTARARSSFDVITVIRAANGLIWQSANLSRSPKLA